MPNKTLVAYYSMSGNTRRLAEEIATALGADLEEIREAHPRRGAWGAIRALADAILRRETPIQAPRRDLRDYGVLVLGGPIWGGQLASPVKTFARMHAANPRRVALFCTEGGRGADKAFVDFERIMGRRSGPALAVDAQHLAPDSHRDALRRFLASLQPAQANGDFRPANSTIG